MPNRKSFTVSRTTTTRANLTWGGTRFNNQFQPTTVFGVDITEAITTRLDRELNNSVLQTVRGQIKVYANPDTANVLTRAVISLGIVWADKNFITTTPSGLYPNPLDESMKWIWRHNYPMAFKAEADVSGDNYRDPGSTIDVHVKSKRKQPSLEHRLFLFGAMDGDFTANLSSIFALGAVNTLIKSI